MLPKLFLLRTYKACSRICHDPCAIIYRESISRIFAPEICYHSGYVFGSFGSGSGNPVRNLHIFRDNDKNILEANLALQSQSCQYGFPIKNICKTLPRMCSFFGKPHRLLYNFHCCTLKAFDIYLSGKETAISCNSCFSPHPPQPLFTSTG